MANGLNDPLPTMGLAHDFTCGFSAPNKDVPLYFPVILV